MVREGDKFGVGDGLGRSAGEYMCWVGRRVGDGDRFGRENGWRRINVGEGDGFQEGEWFMEG